MSPKTVATPQNHHGQLMNIDAVQVSISSTFYKRVFCTKVRFWRQNFLQKLYFGFEIFGAKISYENFVQKTLMKLTTA
jgi:hypothetical protein